MRLLETIGRKDLIGDKRYDTGRARAEREAEVDAMIAEWTKQRDKYSLHDLQSRHKLG